VSRLNMCRPATVKTGALRLLQPLIRIGQGTDSAERMASLSSWRAGPGAWPATCPRTTRDTSDHPHRSVPPICADMCGYLGAVLVVSRMIWTAATPPGSFGRANHSTSGPYQGPSWYPVKITLKWSASSMTARSTDE
jgi:hypothetical protein